MRCAFAESSGKPAFQGLTAEPPPDPLEILFICLPGFRQALFPPEPYQIRGFESALGMRHNGTMGDKTGLLPGSLKYRCPIRIPFLVQNIKFVDGQAIGIRQRKADYAGRDPDDAVDLRTVVFF